MPISHPPFYATYLAKRIGKFATLGLAEDTWALNEGVIGDDDFLQQTYDIDREREAMFFAALDRLRSGTLVSVFDATDRIQHMFWRQLDERRSAHDARSRSCTSTTTRWSAASWIGCGPDDVLMVLSDHGFAPFRRGVNVNSWLRARGLPRAQARNGRHERVAARRGLDEDARLRPWPHGDVPEPRGTRGRRHREARRRGRRVESRDHRPAERPGRSGHRRRSASPRCSTPRVSTRGRTSPTRRTSSSATTPAIATRGTRPRASSRGPCFRTTSKPGAATTASIRASCRASCSAAAPIDEADPALIDIAPTALRLFGIEPPAYMEGKPLFRFATRRKAAAK